MAALARAGVPNPRDADQMYLWEIANLLGLNEPDAPRAPVGPVRDLAAERLYAHEHGLPPPTVDRPSAPPPAVGNLTPASETRRGA